MTIGTNIKNVYFIGIGGISMSGLAHLLHINGFNVHGSDYELKETTQELMNAGITVHIGHDSANITNIDLLVYTAAVKPDNPEFAAAQKLGIKMIDRAELLGLIMKNYNNVVCVAGVHGKTTTTSMVSELFMHSNLNPTIINGGVMPSINAAWRSGGRDYIIAESCEYYDSFLRMFPTIGIILNIELDHADYFPTIDAMYTSFAAFAKRIPNNGTLIINSDTPRLAEITNGLQCNVITFGQQGHWQAESISYDEHGHSSFNALHLGKNLGRIKLGLIGHHNVQNALAALACAQLANIPFEITTQALELFVGAARRYEYKGTMNGAKIYDDYAHHPTEIHVNLNAIKNSVCAKLFVVFQPHTHARTKQLLNEFAESLDAADVIVLLDIFVPVGRKEQSHDIHSKDLAEKIKTRGKEVHYFPSFEQAQSFLLKNAAQGSLIVTMGAGDIYKLGESLLQGGK